MTNLNPVDAMTNPYRALCAELLAALKSWSPHGGGPLQCWEDREEEADLIARAETELAQPVAEGPKPVVDYSRVPEIATEAQIRSAAQYLVKKQNCDGDLIPAIEYAIARWGHLTPQPVVVSERLPGPEYCTTNPRTSQGQWCWGWVQHDPAPYSGRWRMMRREWITDEATHWLPANALPIPEAQ